MVQGYSMKASDLFVKALENEGVKHIFAVPGEENLDLVESLRGSSIELVLMRHEQGAGFMAATYGRLTGRTGVCMATLGPGATNLVTAAAYAQLGGMPMLMITGQKPITKSKQGRFQIIDVVEMMRPITKYAKQIVDGHTIPPIIRQAFREAEREKPGAVHLELPEDIAKEESECPIYEINERFRATAHDSAIKKAVDMIHHAKQPLILIGAGANRKGTTDTLKALVDKLELPFFSTQMGKGVLDERSKLAMGTAALSDGDYVHCAIRHADLIINIGHDVTEKPPFYMEHGGTKVIHINFYPSRTDEVYFPQLDIIGDIDITLKKLFKKLEKQPSWTLDYYHRVKEAVEESTNAGSDDDRFPMFPPRIVADVREAMPDDGIIALDNGVYKIWFARNYKAYHPNTILLDNALASMGAGTPSAMAAKLVNPEKAVIAICGDGGFMMNSHQLEPAVRLGVHFITLVLRDDAYGMIKWKQKNMGFENFGLDFQNPDYVKYAESYGAKGYRVNAASELLPLLKKCIANPDVYLIDIPIDYSENSELLGEELAEITKAFK
jgi:acetolactate synthase-1/2/3 large subunit